MEQSARQLAIAALAQVAFALERAKADRHRIAAFRRAELQLSQLSDSDFASRIASAPTIDLPGVGKTTGGIIDAAVAGEPIEYLAKAAAEAPELVTSSVLDELKGDLHSHSDWSDGTVPIATMAATARSLDRQYQALTDHSPRLRVANGLSPERLQRQIELVDQMNSQFANFQILTGIEVDILADGSLDQTPELLERVDVVVASVHSYLRMDAPAMTERMLKAISHPQVNVLGHCTGRKRTHIHGKIKDRPQSEFDARSVFAACRDNSVAVEVNSQPARRDPPTDLLELARDIGCVFSVDSDAHAPGELSLVDLGARRVQDAHIPSERVVNTKDLADLRVWLEKQE